MAQVTLDGSLTVGPQTSGSNTLPSVTDTVSFTTTPNPKAAQVYECKAYNLQSPSSYHVMSGVGVTDTVTKANFLYLASNASMKLRLTIIDSPANLVSETYFSGLFIQEFTETNALVLVEVKGTGTLQMIATGNQ